MATPPLQFEALLSLNPRDNQGVRFFIPLLHLLDENTEAAVAVFRALYAQRYPDDYPEPSFLFGWALCLTLEGDESAARERYREAILRNIYIAPMLLEETEPPRGLWQPNDRAEPNYAAEFIDSYAVLWDRETWRFADPPGILAGTPASHCGNRRTSRTHGRLPGPALRAGLQETLAAAVAGGRKAYRERALSR